MLHGVCLITLIGKAMASLLFSIDLSKFPALVVGDSTSAKRKAELLTQLGADCTLVSEWAILENYSHNRYKLVVICSDDEGRNQAWHKQLQQAPLIYVSRNQTLSNFSWPSIIQRDNVQIAISNQHKLASLTRWLRTRVESALPTGLGQLVSFMKQTKQQVEQKLESADQRRQFWESALSGAIGESVMAGNIDNATTQLQEKLNSGTSNGYVKLVGAGPGDPGLLTLKALNAIQSADTIVYDRLVSKEVLDLVRRDAEMIYAGKRRSDHHLSQLAINELLVELAKQGKTVVRLKGGDPFIFGRGGEEIETLANANIAFEVIPGITAASGCSSYAGIPLTHRDHAQSCVFITGQQRDDQFDINWNALLQPDQTVVIYMGLHTLPLLSEELISRGKDEYTPAALVQQGTTGNQKVVTGELNNIAEKAKAAGIQPPSLLIIGDVVKLHGQLKWFGD